MSKYDVDKDGHGTCAFCERPLATAADELEWGRRYRACGWDDDDAELNAWADKICWHGWDRPGQCRNGMGIEARLIEVLEQRDALRAELARRDTLDARAER